MVHVHWGTGNTFKFTATIPTLTRKARMTNDERDLLRSQAIAILSERIRKEQPSAFLGHVNFETDRDAKKVTDFIKAYVKQMSEP